MELTKVDTPHKVRPFSCGSEYQVWHRNNCEKCKHYDYDWRKTCVIDCAVGLAAVGDGLITRALYERMGSGTRCKEFEPADLKRIGYEKLGVHLYRVWIGTKPVGTVHAVRGQGWRAMDMHGEDYEAHETRVKAAEGLRKEGQG